jgi:hypothetical protein
MTAKEVIAKEVTKRSSEYYSWILLDSEELTWLGRFPRRDSQVKHILDLAHQKPTIIHICDADKFLQEECGQPGPWKYCGRLDVTESSCKECGTIMTEEAFIKAISLGAIDNE